jgi:hypothetical protein
MAGMRNSPYDWRTPTKQYATPVNTTLDVILIIALTAGFKALIDSEEGKF